MHGMWQHVANTSPRAPGQCPPQLGSAECISIAIIADRTCAMVFRIGSGKDAADLAITVHDVEGAVAVAGLAARSLPPLKGQSGLTFPASLERPGRCKPVRETQGECPSTS